MEDFLHSFYVIHTTFEDEQKKFKRPRCQKDVVTTTTPIGSSSRHIVWTDQERRSYTLLRAGIPLTRREDADALYETGALTEGHFYIFGHQDTHLDRNALVPKYEAAYFFSNSGEYVRVKKCHLKAAYQTLGRCTHSEIWSVDSETGLPYWVDRHAFSKKKQQKSKRKYEKSKKGFQ
jgi:hypothetical protein